MKVALLQRSTLLLALFTCASVAPAAPARPDGDGGAAGTARCEVWARELSFAQSVADHDAAAFAGHVHPDAVFGVSRPNPQRGQAEILTAWDGLIAGVQTRLWWYPDYVHAGGDGSVAASSGPALYQDVASGQYRLGRFSSVWQRGADGTWRVVFDDGMAPKPADAAQAEAFHRGRVQACPPA